MKKYILFLLTNIFIITVHAQISATSINGTWQTVAKDAELTIYNEGNLFFGKITWLKVPGKDDKNPQISLRSRDLVGTVILTNFTFNGRDRWENGKIYDPSGGKTYSCTMKLKEPNKLDIRGYIGISLLGRTEVWTRSSR